MQPEKNQIITARITGITSEGQGVAKPEGFPVFVPYTAIGDLAEIRIVKLRRGYAYGRLERLIEPSPDRVPPDCSAFGPCGGCHFRHLSYEAEARVKRNILADAFLRVGHFSLEPEDFLAAKEVTRCRNKAQIPFGTDQNGRIVYGFYAPRSHRIVPCADCLLQPRLFGEIAAKTARLLQTLSIPCYDETTGRGTFRHLYLRQSAASGKVLVCFVVTRGRLSAIRELARRLMTAFPDICGVTENVNPDCTNVILGKETETLFGDGRLEDILCGVPLSLSPESFYQVNHAQTERLYRQAAAYAAPNKTDLLLDLYCGAGSIGLSMAKRVKRLIGVEIVPQAIENAKESAAKMGLSNTAFFCGDAGNIAARLAGEGLRPDIILIDPPRKGCDEACLSAIREMSPDRLVMISCHPATAARDCRRLCDLGFTLERYCGADLFPRTRHVECVVLLSKAK